MFQGELRQPVNRLAGIGPNHHKSLSALGILSVGQLLSHFPQRYEDHQSLRTIVQAAGVEPVNCPVSVVGRDSFYWKGKQTLKLFVEDEEGTRGTLLCYNRNFLGNKLSNDSELYLYGSVPA